MKWHEFTHDGSTYCALIDNGRVSVGIYSGPLSCAPEAIDRSVKRSFQWHGPKSLALYFRGSAVAVAEAVGMDVEYMRDLASEIDAIDRYDANVTMRSLTGEEVTIEPYIVSAVALLADVAESDVRIRVMVNRNNTPPSEYVSVECLLGGRWERPSTPEGYGKVFEHDTMREVLADLSDSLEFVSQRVSLDAAASREKAEKDARRDADLKRALRIIRGCGQ